MFKNTFEKFDILGYFGILIVVGYRKQGETFQNAGMSVFKSTNFSLSNLYCEEYFMSKIIVEYKLFNIVSQESNVLLNAIEDSHTFSRVRADCKYCVKC